ncbi:Nematode cuticle collagen N-terminal domain-containing protein [Caenorhabditis elegans]|uniref:Nematode cuticle collagen N-terminal domain-containing protein n=1 Tax=Caenorhabditis elegans TaxID=6239 RepID=Q9XUT4_CAEEL|nr:Nematode cuticle collagen N-terminal domain-containing protein [Caenorhabditis elegans]CAB04587.1 Nematode cuticle collagen N-terminal domain-containing protein [Caenorhabditis elegans]|eukprot:NP_492936.1 COLlagen [Caenorhabditis elegans]
MSRFLAGTLSAISGIVILGSLVIAGVLFNDINTLYFDVMDDMHEFKLLADDAWNKMITVEHNAPNTLDSLFKRGKRQSGSSCNCGPQPSNCPAGPAGPPGEPGQPGDDGAPGKAGDNGHDGIPSPIDAYAQHDCIKCPAGAPGPAGPDGEAGAPGPDGQPGQDGPAGIDGAPGEAGPQGDAGAAGQDGEAGAPGPAGKNGQRGQGAPGPQGPEGPAGAAGQDGAPGEDGAPGAQGTEGIAGAPGKDGETGPDGAAGEAGGEGAPGPDAAYCPCPPRTVGYGEVDQPQAEQSGYRRRAARRL